MLQSVNATGSTDTSAGILLNPIFRRRSPQPRYTVQPQLTKQPTRSGYSHLVVPKQHHPAWNTITDIGIYTPGVLRRLIYNTKQSPTQGASDDESALDGPMDSEELAALNAIINTRRSMAAAQALAQGKASSDAESDADTCSSDCVAHNRPSSAARCIKFAPLPSTEEAEDEDDSDEISTTSPRRPPVRRLSTGTAGIRSAMERTRLGMDDTAESSRRKKLLRLIVPNEPESEPELTPEERRRRRELIKQIRPSGTGMVTLLDGGRVEARKVGNPEHEREVEEEMQMQLWGFAALAQRACQVQSETESDHDVEIEEPEESPSSWDRSQHQSKPANTTCRPLKDLGDELYRRHEIEMQVLGAEALETHRQASKDESAASLRITPDPRVSMPNPSPLFPRRPDAKGHLVVPLNQLGIRPSRPLEGRFWHWYDSDDDMDDSDDDAPETRMSQEDIAEDKRQCSILWKHATSRAAAQEVVHSRRKGKKRATTTHPTSPDGHKKVSAKERVLLLADGDEFWPRRSRTGIMLEKYA